MVVPGNGKAINAFSGILFFMEDLVARVEALKKDPNACGLVRARLAEFKALGMAGNEALFSELCFCIMTANFDAAKSIRVQENVGNGFTALSEKRLEQRLRSLGYRYPNRAAYICDSRRHLGQLKQRIASFKEEAELREWLARNVKGLGMKEASHFMRNIGFEKVAIIDFHIVDLLAREGLIEKPKTVTKKRYLEIEKVLAWLAERLGIGLAELDLYLWFLETGKMLK
jgi:N-glycosylase/DNA lyase